MSTESCKSLRDRSIPRNHDGTTLPDGRAPLVGREFPVGRCDPDQQFPPGMIARIRRDTALVCGLMALVSALWFRNVAVPMGVIGGGLLIALSFWAIRGSVDAFVGFRSESETARKPARFHLVKFFTRHAMLALAAYGMMVRLQLDPVAMLLGVTSLGVAVAAEAVRSLRWRRFP